MIESNSIFRLAAKPQNPSSNQHRRCNIPVDLRKPLCAAGAIGALLCAPMAMAQLSITVVIGPATAGPSISSNFTGLSYEMSLLLPGKNGKHFFSPENKPLLQMFRTLGIKSLRVGGNTAERDTVALPGKAEIDSLFAFAKAAGVQVIYTLRLNGADPQADAETAKYVMDHYNSELTCFTLGNEPEKITTNYPPYREMFGKFLGVITAPTNAPEARFSGPSTTHMNVSWSGQFARDFGRDRRIVLVSQHEYPARSGRNMTNAAAGCGKLLSPDLLKLYAAFHNEFVPAALSNGLPYRLEEANSFSNGGARGVSDAFAAALWGLDYLYWWAAQGAAGINFHTGGYVPGTQPRPPMNYAVFWNADDGLAARPLAYALKAFDLAANGRLVPVKSASNAGNINFRTYAVLAADKELYVTLINKENGPGRRDAEVTLSAGTNYVCGEVMLLTAPGGDVQAKSGVTLGGASIGNDGRWNGDWTPLAAPPSRGRFTLKVPAASAAIVKLTTD
jgi:hypothetical protein